MMYKQKYTESTLEIVIFQTEDVITSSGAFDGPEHEFGTP